MQKQLINLSLLLLLITGCKLSAFNQNSDQNENSISRREISNAAFNSANTTINSNSVSQSETASRQVNNVCSDPLNPCHHKEKTFDDWELSFKMPAKLLPNKPYKSAPFYAVILKTYEMNDDCDGGEYIEAVEAERKKVQSDQPQRKVFAAYQCPNMGAVDYDFEGKLSANKESILIGNFLAIYSGATQSEAEKILQSVKDEYPDAVIKQMTASYERIEQ